MAERRRSGADRLAAAVERRAARADVTDPQVVMEAAAGFLAVRPRSMVETRRRLRHLGYPAELIEQALERLVEMRYLDDEAFATAWVESRDRARPRGESALRRELAVKGIDRETVRQVLVERRAPANQEATDGEASTDPERVAAQHLLDRRRAALQRESDPRKRRQKAYALLARNGFGPDICREVAASIDSDPDLGVAEDP